jgi:cytoskeletal protein CcmA (bactofilin family)
MYCLHESVKMVRHYRNARTVGMSNSSTNKGGAKGRRFLDRVTDFATSIGPDTRLQGSIGGDGHCIVHGTVEGEGDFAGTLVIAATGRWLGDIRAANIIIAGQVEGVVTAQEKLEIVSTARIKGKLFSPVIAIAEGAVHDGEMRMSGDAAPTRFQEQRGAAV